MQGQGIYHLIITHYCEMRSVYNIYYLDNLLMLLEIVPKS
jgi:hypothetical protein